MYTLVHGRINSAHKEKIDPGCPNQLVRGYCTMSFDSLGVMPWCPHHPVPLCTQLWGTIQITVALDGVPKFQREAWGIGEP